MRSHDNPKRTFEAKSGLKRPRQIDTKENSPQQLKKPKMTSNNKSIEYYDNLKKAFSTISCLSQHILFM